MVINDLLKRRMKEHGLTQKALADMVGISYNSMSSIMRGRYSPSLKTLEAILFNLDLTIIIAPTEDVENNSLPDIKLIGGYPINKPKV